MSDYPLISANGSDGEIDDTENMSMTPSTTKVFNGDNAYSTYISQKYEENPTFTVRFAKKTCGRETGDYFYENELRQMNRLLTGKAGYSWLKIVNDSVMETDYYYRARVSAIEYERLGYHVVGYDVSFELDGGMAYSEEQKITISATANRSFYIVCNSDDLYGYTLPVITVKPASAGTLTLTNSTDSWSSSINNMNAGETLTIDSKKELLSSSRTRQYILNDFNLHWPRLLPGKNVFVCNRNATVEYVFRAARKVGFVS
jgi:hypothetical protein